MRGQSCGTHVGPRFVAAIRRRWTLGERAGRGKGELLPVENHAAVHVRRTRDDDNPRHYASLGLVMAKSGTGRAMIWGRQGLWEGR